MPQNKLLHLATSGVGFLVTGLLLVSLKLYDFSEKNKQLKDKISLEKSIHQHQISEILRLYDSLKETRGVNPVAATPVAVTCANPAPKNQGSTDDNSLHALPKNIRLIANKVSARGVRLIMKDAVETDLSTKMDQVRIRFTLKKNKDIEPGDKQIFIQIYNPKNRLLALKGKYEKQVSEMVYFNGSNTDACLFINLHQHQLIVGEYQINLIHNRAIIGSTKFRVY